MATNCPNRDKKVWFYFVNHLPGGNIPKGILHQVQLDHDAFVAALNHTQNIGLWSMDNEEISKEASKEIFKWLIQQKHIDQSIANKYNDIDELIITRGSPEEHEKMAKAMILTAAFQKLMKDMEQQNNINKK